MKILITGGAGYVGTGLVYQLAHNPSIDEIIIYDNLQRKNHNLFIGFSKLDSRIKFVQADILDSLTLKEQLVGVDIVYHLAARASTPFSDKDPHFFEQINNGGTAELVYALEDSNVKTVIHLSSASVYGASPEIASEETILNPETFYGISKMRGERHMKRLFNEKYNTFIIRLGNVYGYNKSMRFESVINKFAFSANFQNEVTINGDGKQHRSFIHIDTTSNILAKLITLPIPNGIYNLSEDDFSINYVADTLLEIHPELDMIYTNQDIKLRELRIKPNPLISDLASTPMRTLKDILIEFKNKFTF